MPLTLAEVISPATNDETLSTLTALAAVAGFPATSWQSGTVPRTFFEIESIAYSDLKQVVSAIATGGFVDHAEGAWLTLRAAQGYNLQREPAVRARGPLRLTDADGIGPVTITTPGQVVVQSEGVRFRVVDSDDPSLALPITLPASGSAVLMFEAERPGTSGNLLENASFEMVTASLSGVTVAQELTPGEPWLAQQGRDEENDPDLRARCKARWKANGNAATELAYKLLTIKASNLPAIDPERRVSRVTVKEDTATGAVTVYVASNLGAVESEVISLIEPDIQAIRPQCVQVSLVSAANRTVTFSGTINVKAAQLDAAKVAVQKAVQAYLSTLPIGGFSYVSDIDSLTHHVLYLAPIEVAALNAHPGIVNVYLGGLFTGGEFELNPYDVAVPDLSGVSWVTT